MQPLPPRRQDAAASMKTRPNPINRPVPFLNTLFLFEITRFSQADAFYAFPLDLKYIITCIYSHHQSNASDMAWYLYILK